MSDINSILQEIKKTKKQLTVYIPSLQTEVNIAPVTLAQQSKIIESISDNVTIANNPILALLEFNSIMFSILKANIEEYQPIYNTIDRINLIIALKSHIDKVITDDNDLDFDLNTMLARNAELEYTAMGETLTVDDITFEVAPPTLEEDNIVNNLVLRKYKASSIKNKSLLSDVYIYESLKFIKSVTIGENKAEIKNDSKSLELLKQIDTSTLKPVFEYISKIRDIEESYAKHPTTDNVLDLTPDIFIS